MASYIVYFDYENNIIDVSRFAECEYEDYLKHLDAAINRGDKIQHGYF